MASCRTHTWAHWTCSSCTCVSGGFRLLVYFLFIIYHYLHQYTFIECFLIWAGCTILTEIVSRNKIKIKKTKQKTKTKKLVSRNYYGGASQPQFLVPVISMSYPSWIIVGSPIIQMDRSLGNFSDSTWILPRSAVISNFTSERSVITRPRGNKLTHTTWGRSLSFLGNDLMGWPGNSHTAKHMVHLYNWTKETL